MNVENRMAAQSGMRVWTTKGRDSRAIALATSKVTRKRWWSVTTDRIIFAILTYFSFFFIVIISNSIVLIESRPTVIPEQKAPTHVRTILSKFYTLPRPHSTKIMRPMENDSDYRRFHALNYKLHYDYQYILLYEFTCLKRVTQAWALIV